MVRVRTKQNCNWGLFTSLFVIRNWGSETLNNMLQRMIYVSFTNTFYSWICIKNVTFLPGLNIENSLYTESLKTSTYANCEDMDGIHSGLHCL